MIKIHVVTTLCSYFMFSRQFFSVIQIVFKITRKFCKFSFENNHTLPIPNLQQRGVITMRIVVLRLYWEKLVIH